MAIAATTATTVVTTTVVTTTVVTTTPFTTPFTVTAGVKGIDTAGGVSLTILGRCVRS
jgi:hypothetical protein